jgi:thiol peroxidase
MVTFKGNPLTLEGTLPEVGQPAPAFTVLDTALSPVTLAAFRGKRTVLLSVPSLDTPVCDTEARRFNQAAGALGADVRVALVSMDLPFAQLRWCGAAGVQAVKTYSDHREASFGRAYGVLIREWRLLARAVFVLDAAGVLRYRDLVPEIAQEPNYEAALAAVAKLA